MKNKLLKIVSFILASVMVLSSLASCGGTDNMVFSSEDEMKNYLKGTFDAENGTVIIDGAKMVFIDKGELFDTAENSMSKALEVLDGINKSALTLYQLYDACAEKEIGISESSINEYQYKQGKVIYDSSSEELNVNADGNLCDEDGNVYVWVSEEVDIPREILQSLFNEYKPLLIEHWKTELSKTPVPENALLSAMNSYCNYSPETLSGWYAAPIGIIIANACPYYSISYSNYEVEKQDLMETKRIDKFESDNRSYDLSNAYFVKVTGRTRYSPQTSLATDYENVATVLILLDSSNKPVYYSFIEISDTLETFSMIYLI